MSQLVTFRPIGRMGNIMFQVAACIGYARKYGVDYAVPSDRYETTNFLNYFPKLRPKVNDLNFTRYEEHPHGRDNWFDYHPIPFSPYGISLMGFWQSEKYFENAKQEVIEIFELPDYQDVRPYCSVHVRRTDYVTYNTNFPPVTLDYIHKAMNEQASRGNERFLVFSDDIEWCKKNIVGDYEIKFSEGKGEFEDMAFMASCGNHIIANSSFSWWAAYLGKNPDRVIVSPSQEGNNWFGPDWDNKNPNKPKTLIPDSWIQIKFR